MNMVMLYYLKLSKQMDFKTMKLRFQNKEENIMCATIKIRRITMGQCYSVNLKIKLKSGSEKRAAEALRAHMFGDDRTNYHFDKFANLGVGTEKLDDLIRICLAGWKLTTYFTAESWGWKKYSNDFDCSYGWESVMVEMFEVLTPFLEEQSEIDIYPDSDSFHGHVENGKCIWH